MDLRSIQPKPFWILWFSDHIQAVEEHLGAQCAPSLSHPRQYRAVPGPLGLAVGMGTGIGMGTGMGSAGLCPSSCPASLHSL